MNEISFHNQLKQEMDAYVHEVYFATKTFPRDELYGVTSQLRRSALSVILNYIEGYARMKSKVHKNFLEISYGSLKESKYLIEFSYKEKYLNEQYFISLTEKSERIGKMLWGIIKNIP